MQQQEAEQANRADERKYAIGRRWLEKFWPDVFNYGQVSLRKPDGSVVKCGVPRYYEKWLRDHRFDDYLRYLSEVKYPMNASMAVKAAQELARHNEVNQGNALTMSRSEVKYQILQSKFNQLQRYLKL